MNATTLLAFLGGLAAGAGIALLLAPTSGGELRQRIGRILEEKGVSRDKFDAIIAQAKAKLAEATDRIPDLETIIDNILKQEGDASEKTV